MPFSSLENDLVSKVLVGGSALCALLLGFGYFLMNWATTRVRDLESSRHSRGDATLVVWTGGVGVLIAAIIGVHVFGIIYLRTIGDSIGYRWTPLLAMAIVAAWHWTILTWWLVWCIALRCDLKKLTSLQLSKLIDWRLPVWTTIPGFYLIGVCAFLECAGGSFPAGLILVFVILTGSFGIGGYCPLRGDLLPRTILETAIQIQTTSEMVSVLDIDEDSSLQ